jgi:hypothetical protein
MKETCRKTEDGMAMDLRKFGSWAVEWIGFIWLRIGTGGGLF